MKIVIAIDKFKGSATAQQLAQCINDAIVRKMPDAITCQVPIADGGDGTMHAIKTIMGNKVKEHMVMVHRPILNLNPVDAQYLLDESNRTAYMDLATASGLTLVPPLSRDIMSASTFGTGEMIADALSHGATHIVMGLGGSATCDGAMGILSALGCEFLDADMKHLMPCGGNLRRIAHVNVSGMSVPEQGIKFTLLTDVNNPLYGPQGAAHVFGPQKGASPLQVDELDNGLKNFAQFMPSGVTYLAGAGAAGGVAAGMVAFVDATITPGIDYMLDMAHFDEAIADAQLVITGEGRIDKQTAMGKAPSGVLKAARRYNVPVVALCGSIAPGTDISQLGFDHVIEVSPHNMPLHEAMIPATTLSNVEKAISAFISEWK